MSKKIQFFCRKNDETLGCAVYNSDKKELIGLFKTRKLASIYIYGIDGIKKINYISQVISQKICIKKDSNILGFNVTIRNLTTKQKEELKIK